MSVRSIPWWRSLFGRCELGLINGEPSLDEILNEPIIRLMMARDGVKPQSLRATLTEIANRAVNRHRPAEPRAIWF
jgi:hypothetical protein